MLERALVRALANRLGVDPDRDLYPAVVVASAVAALRTTLMWWYEHGQSVPLASALEQAFAALAAGESSPTP
jgi:hypothetical protein